MGFVEPEMNMEEQFYIDDKTIEVDTLEQNINDEMVGVLVLNNRSLQIWSLMNQKWNHQL